jgi:DNA sulfur modification protein DndD
MLHFNKLIVENFGPYKGKQDIDFSESDGVSIIWGNNGVGKTTLLNVFRYALYGKIQGRTKVHQLDKFVNNDSRELGNQSFTVTLFLSDDLEKYEITRKYTIGQREELFIKKDQSILAPDQRDHFLNSIMPEEVSRFFLFDGELLKEYEELLEDESSIGKKIKDSIEKILGVPILVNGLSDSKIVEKEYETLYSKAVQSNSGTETMGIMLEGSQIELKIAEDEYKTLLRKLDVQQVEKNELEEYMKQTEHSRDLIANIKSLKMLIEQQDEYLSKRKLELRDLLKFKWAGIMSDKLNSTLESLQNEITILDDKNRNGIVANEMISQFKKAIDSESCPVCEQKVEDEVKTRLNSKLSRIVSESGLSDDEHSRLTELKSRRLQLTKLRTGSIIERIVEIESMIDEIIVAKSDYESQLSDFEIALSEFENTDNIEKIVKDYTKCSESIKVIEAALITQKEIIDSLKDKIKNLEEKIKTFSRGDALVIAEKKRNACGRITSLLEKGVSLYRNKLKDSVEKDASEIFVAISNQKEYISLKINENYGLSIINKAGKIVEIRSAGYEHIVALALIGALHKNAPLQGPIIMDSPFGRLDPDHKTKITNVLPHLANQVVLLLYKTEIDENETREILGSALLHEYSLKAQTSTYTEIERIHNG